MNHMQPFDLVTYARAWIVRVACAAAIFSGASFSLIVPAGGIVGAANPPSNAINANVPPRTFIRRLGSSVPVPPRAGEPIRLKIPAINVDAAVEQVGQTADGSMDVPKDFAATAWYDLGARPGERGNAVVAGHVDSTMGKAVFWDLRKLVSGDKIVVVGDDSVERTFVVMASEAYLRADVPLDRVFGSTTDARLNLITCDSNSAFDRTHGEYAGNLVVYARAAP